MRLALLYQQYLRKMSTKIASEQVSIGVRNYMDNCGCMHEFGDHLCLYIGVSYKLKLQCL